MNAAIGVDIGGTKIAAGLVDDHGTILDATHASTPDDAGHIARVVVDLVERLDGEHESDGVGIGAAGFVDADRATIRFAPNIHWRETPLAAQVRELLDVPVIVENDANAAAWGEYRFGAGTDVEDLLLVTVGTGIGGGIVHQGGLFRGSHGFAAEIGHMRLVPDGLLCGCGQRGCWEQYASGRALVREACRHLDEADRAAAGLAALAEGDADRITGPMIAQLARDGDELCIALFAEIGRRLGEGVAMLSAVLDPRVVAFGGGVADAGDLFLAPAAAAFDEHLTAREHRTPAQLRLARLGNDAGLIGAADLVRSEPA